MPQKIPKGHFAATLLKAVFASEILKQKNTFKIDLFLFFYAFPTLQLIACKAECCGISGKSILPLQSLVSQTDISRWAGHPLNEDGVETKCCLSIEDASFI
ncbi:hypothetical protein LJC00_01065 [Dysgonomonas sp. OttesenSCG-928-M03]|nr:hypothetical protein [Dysgonomonas sp. OttesenSCG-928-M03]